jgi:RimJ/RimL family protein N-acetyltransferase
MSFDVIPYLFIDSNWTLTDYTMGEIWSKAVCDGVIQRTFISGQVTTLGQFLMMMQNRNNLVSLVVEEAENPAALFWLSDFGRNNASSHFFVFKEYWGKRTKEVGATILKYWFDFKRTGTDEPLIDLLIGRIPLSNQAAIMYSKRFGFKECGRIPNMVWDVINQVYHDLVILVMERKDWKNGKK